MSHSIDGKCSGRTTPAGARRSIAGRLLFRSAAILAVGAALPAAGVAAATPTRDPVMLVIVNETAAPVACEAALAHWFSMRLGTIAAGGTLRVALERDGAGALSISTAADVAAPVERIWCGRAGRAWETAVTVPLPRVGSAATHRVVCTADPATERLTCRARE